MPSNSQIHSGNTTEVTRLDHPVIVANQSWPDDIVPLVTVRCITYNHGQFIRSCLEGFLMQETTFPIEILIHDDASQDETQSIIKEFQQKHPTVIRAILQTENQYSKGGFEAVRTELSHRTRGLYVALCEGDDYWTDPKKLQKQVDLMEANPGYSMCGTIVRCVKVSPDGTEEEIPSIFQTSDTREVLKIEDFLGSYPIHTSTVLYQRDLCRSRPEFFKNILNGDVCLFAMLAEKGDAGFIRECTSTYRIHPGGIYSSKTHIQRLRAFQNTCNHLNRYFKGRYVQHLREWEHTDASKIWATLWQEGKYLDASILYLELLPRYARHVTVVPWAKTRAASAFDSARKILVRTRMRIGIRTRIRRMFKSKS